MILEVAILHIKPELNHSFESTFKEASKIIANMEGYIEHQLQKCLEQENKYILLVRWETLEHHEIGFRGSEQYQQWKALLHHYYSPYPVVEHYREIVLNE